MASKTKFNAIGIGPAHYIGPEHGGSLAGRACNTCIHIRRIDGKLTGVPSGMNPAGCVHPKVLRTRQIAKIPPGLAVIDRAGCCDFWRDK